MYDVELENVIISYEKKKKEYMYEGSYWMHEEFAPLQKEEKIRGLHKWASMARSFVKLWKIFHHKWSLATIEPPLFWLGCAPPNMLQNSTSAISSTSNEYNITLTTSWKTLKPTLSLPFFCHLRLPIARILSKVSPT